MGDFVIQRRVAYQLASCLDDLDWQMNLLIREAICGLNCCPVHLLTAGTRTSSSGRSTPFAADRRKQPEIFKSDGALSLHIPKHGYTPVDVYRSCAQCSAG